MNRRAPLAGGEGAKTPRRPAPLRDPQDYVRTSALREVATITGIMIVAAWIGAGAALAPDLLAWLFP